MVAKNVQALLEHTSLSDVTAYTEIVYDPDPTTSVRIYCHLHFLLATIFFLLSDRAQRCILGN